MRKIHISLGGILLLFFVSCQTGPRTDTSKPSKTAAKRKKIPQGKKYYCSVYLSKTSGSVGSYFSTQIRYRSNFIGSPQYYVNKLPSGLAYNSSTGKIYGTPKTFGQWKIKVGVRDRYKGTHRQPRGQRWYYLATLSLRVKNNSYVRPKKNSSKSKYYCRVDYSLPTATRGKYYSGAITYSSNYIRTPHYYAKYLPPGLMVNSYTGKIYGRPKTRGTWKIEIGVRDRYKGTHFHPNTKDWWYLKSQIPLIVRSSPARPAPSPVRRAPFPAPQRLGRTYSTRSQWTIKNQTNYSLYISYSGPSRGKITIYSNSTRTISLPGGSYKVNGSSGKPGVIPYYGVIYFKSGWKYGNRFYIRKVPGKKRKFY